MGLITLTFSELKKNYKVDFIAGLTVAVLLVPQGMAYAMLAGLPPIYGLYTAIIPSFLYPLFGSSKHISAGPTAVISILIFSGLLQFAVPESQEFISLAILVTFVSGLLFLISAALRLGFLAKVISYPVIVGFSTAAACLIVVSQIKNLTGLEIDDSLSVFQKIKYGFSHLHQYNPITLAIGIASIFIITFTKKFSPKIPGALLVVLLGIFLICIFKWDQSGVEIIKDIPGGFPRFILPDFSVKNLVKILPFTIVLSLISFMEAIAIAKTVSKRAGYYEIEPDKEFLGLGVANLVSSFLQCYPSTSSFSRSALNYDAGAKTAWSSIFAAIIITFVLVFLTQYLYYLPKAILAAIIMTSVLKLVSILEIKELWSSSKFDFLVFFVTFVSTFIVSLEKGIFIGILLAFLFLIFHLIQKKQLNFSNLLGSKNPTPVTILEQNQLVPTKPITYLNFEGEIANLKQVIINSQLKDLRLQLEHTYVDSTGFQALNNMKSEFSQKGINIILD